MKKSAVWAALQMSSQGDVAGNLERAASLCREAASRGAEVAVLPENFAFFGPDPDKANHAERIAKDGWGPILTACSQIAKEHGMWIVAGGIPLAADGQGAPPLNASVVVDPNGAIVADYAKIHLFDVELKDGASYRESDFTTPGSTPKVADIAGCRTGLSVCYDVRFPELYRAMVDDGAEVITVPAAFTLVTGKDHWHVLLRARAIEAQCYVVAAGQWGKHPENRRTYGKSCIIDPWGEVIAQASEGEGMALAELRQDQLERVRRSLPALQHRRL